MKISAFTRNKVGIAFGSADAAKELCDAIEEAATTGPVPIPEPVPESEEPVLVTPAPNPATRKPSRR